MARRTVKSLAKGESLTLSNDVFADLVPGTGAVSVSVGASAALDAAALLAALDRYPYRCSEQITSRALPLLYVSELAKGNPAAADPAADQHIRDAIEALLTRQDSNGSFGLWGVGGDDTWLDAYVTDFLTRARERKIAVPDGAFKLAINRLRNVVANTTDPDKNGATGLAYALYVLARNGMAPVGDLRYLADAKLDALATPIAKAQIAAALAMVGDRVRADRVYTAALAAMPTSTSRRSPRPRGFWLDACAMPPPLWRWQAKAGRRVRPCRRRYSASKPLAPVCGRRQHRRMPGCCSRQTTWPRMPARCRWMSAVLR